LAKKNVLDVNNTIWSIDASRVLGISKFTFNKRLCAGNYSIECVRTPKGYRYSIRDVFKMAHPTLKEKQIEDLILEFRMKKAVIKKRKNKKAGVKQ
jgi:hypothetical protein